MLISRMSEGYELVFAFRDQSPSFSHGFTCGRIWDRMMQSKQPFAMTVQEEIREDIIAMATAAGWTEQFVEKGGGWLSVGLAPAV